LEGVRGSRLFLAGTLVYFTGYLISASSSLPRELRYQKMKEKKRKKAKTIKFLLVEPIPFFIGFTVSFPSFVSNRYKI
jgi:hypothetical protein